MTASEMRDTMYDVVCGGLLLCFSLYAEHVCGKVSSM